MEEELNKVVKELKVFASQAEKLGDEKQRRTYLNTAKKIEIILAKHGE